MQKPLQQHVLEMRKMAQTLVPFTFPQATIDAEQKIVFLKQRQIVLDGYDISISLSKADYSDGNFIESLQICSAHAPFLPFHVVCKIGRAFLGEDHLAYAEFFKRGCKTYCWTLRYQEEDKIPPTERAEDAEYEGFEYKVLPQGCGNLYDC